MKSIIRNKDIMIDLFFIIIGSLISSVGVNMFLIHAKLLSGGVTGIALIFQYLFGFEAGYTVLLLNIPLFILSYKKLDKKFTLFSAVGTLTISIGLILTNPIARILNINDKLLYCLYGGVVMGIGFGLVFTHNGSTGGLDIISMLIKKKYSNFNIGKISFSVNLIIVTIGAVVFGIPTALYTLIAMYLSSIVLDNVVKGLNQKKLIFIVTEKEDEVTKLIMTKLKRGVTSLYGEGGYTKEKKRVLYCIIPLSQVPRLKEIIRSTDDKAFLTIADATEVQGKGFKQVL